MIFPDNEIPGVVRSILGLGPGDNPLSAGLEGVPPRRREGPELPVAAWVGGQGRGRVHPVKPIF